MKTTVAVALALTLSFTGIVGNHAEAARSKPDLIVSAVSAPSPASPNATIVVSGTVKNQGKASAKTFGVAYYLSTSPSSTTGAAVLGTQNVSSLAAGASVALVTSFTVPGSTASGTFYVVAVADSTAVVRESNENNNSGTSGAVAVQDTTPPAISAVTTSSVTASGATTTWMTDKSSTSQVEFGLTTAYGNMSAPNTSLVTSHGVTLSGLAANTGYHFRVHSTDASGNAAVSSDYTFITATAAATSTGTTYYVATTGSDSNLGTSAQPFRTINKGMSVLQPGDTLYIGTGTYVEGLSTYNHNIAGGTSWSAPVTVAAYPGDTVILAPPTGTDRVLTLAHPQAAYMIFDGLILDGTNVTYDVVKISWAVSGDTTTAAHHIRIQNSELRNAPGQGVQIGGVGADWNEFINVNVHHNGQTEWDHGFYIESSHNLVENSSVHDNAGYGVHVYNGYTGRRADDNLVRNNRVFNNGWRGILLGSGDGNVAYNNLVWNNRGGIRVNFNDPTNSQVYNNTVYGNTDWGILVQAGTGAVVQNNIVYENGAPELQDTATGSTIDHNLVGIDPKFVGAATGDFRLRPGSPAIDTGTTLSTVTKDIVGTPRPKGTAHDIGAYEIADEMVP